MNILHKVYDLKSNKKRTCELMAIENGNKNKFVIFFLRTSRQCMALNYYAIAFKCARILY